MYLSVGVRTWLLAVGAQEMGPAAAAAWKEPLSANGTMPVPPDFAAFAVLAASRPGFGSGTLAVSQAISDTRPSRSGRATRRLEDIWVSIVASHWMEANAR